MSVQSRRRRRRGMTSVVVLVLLFVIAIVATSLVRVSAAYHKRTRANETALQSGLLADAGVDRALARIAADPKYAGERWEVPTEALATVPGEQRPAAVVTIEVAASPDGGPRKLRVRADYPPEPPGRVRSSREIMLP